MSKKVKKGTVGLTVLVLAGGLAAGCSKEEPGANSKSTEEKKIAGFNATGFPIVNEKITLTMTGPKQAIQGPWEQMDFFKEMEAKTNIHFEFDTPSAASFDEKKNLAFASGQLSDIWFASKLNPADEVNYGGQGLLIPLDDLIDKYAPNIKKMLMDKPEVKKSITTINGHIYALPQVTELAHNQISKVWINGDWLKNVGVEASPATTEELYSLLKKFKDSDANKNGVEDEIPMSASNIDGIRPNILAGFGYLSNWIDVKGDKAVFVPTTEGYKQYLIYMNKLYAEKLLDNEIFAQTEQQFTAKGKANKVGVFPHAAPFLFLDIKSDEENFKHPTLLPLTSPVNNEKMYPLMNPIQRGTFAITKNNKNPEATIRWVDYLYSEEGGALLNSGIEGKGWKWLDEGKTKWDRLTANGKNVEETRGQNTPDTANIAPTFKGKSFHYKINNPVTQWLHKVSEEYLKVARSAYPLVYFTDDEQKRLNVLTTDIQTYVKQMEAKFIIDKNNLSGWDNYVSTIQKMNADELVKIYQAAYDRWKNAK